MWIYATDANPDKKENFTLIIAEKKILHVYNNDYYHQKADCNNPLLLNIQLKADNFGHLYLIKINLFEQEKALPVKKEFCNCKYWPNFSLKCNYGRAFF